MNVVADLHGRFDLLPSMLEKLGSFVIAGDVGVGFNHSHDRRLLEFLDNNPGKIRLLRGNHDNPTDLREMFSEHFIEDGTIEDGVLFLGGAESIDKDLRIPGYSWWAEESLAWETLDGLSNLSEVHTIVAHDLPASWYHHEIPPALTVPLGMTPMVLDEVVLRTPGLRRYIHGHLHAPKQYTVGRVKVVCLLPADRWESKSSHKDIIWAG